MQLLLMGNFSERGRLSIDPCVLRAGLKISVVLICHATLAGERSRAGA